MAAVLLACATGVFFGAMSVVVRFALRRAPDVESGSLVMTTVGLVVALIAAAASGALDDVRFGDIWPFLATGLFVPGLAQVLFVQSVRDAGPSRAGVLIGMSPALSALIALAILGEPFHAALAIGTVLIVAGGIALAWERSRPEHFKAIGVVFALSCAVLLAMRDNAARWGAERSDASSIAATTALIAAASAFLLVYLLVRSSRESPIRRLRRTFVPFVPAGLLVGIGYLLQIAALDLGRVTVVAPLLGTHALWTVFISALLIRRSDAVGRRLVLAAVLIVGGSALIGAFR